MLYTYFLISLMKSICLNDKLRPFWCNLVSDDLHRTFSSLKCWWCSSSVVKVSRVCVTAVIQVALLPVILSNVLDSSRHEQLTFTASASCDKFRLVATERENWIDRVNWLQATTAIVCSHFNILKLSESVFVWSCWTGFALF